MLQFVEEVTAVWTVRNLAPSSRAFNSAIVTFVLQVGPCCLHFEETRRSQSAGAKAPC